MPEPVIDLLDAVWSDIAGVCRTLGDEQWDAATDCPGWSVRDQVAHMIGTERMLQGAQPPAASGPVDDAAHVRNDIGRFNEQWVAAYRTRPGAAVLDDFRAVTDERRAELRALPAAKWDEEGFTPEGPGPYRSFMEIRVFDCWYHEQDIREAVGAPGGLDGPVADLVVDRIARKGLPYVVGKKAAAPQGSTVVFDVAGRDPRRYAIGVDGRAALLDEVPDAPTARIDLDRRTLTRLAGGRWTGARARADGRLASTGDAALAASVIDNLAFTI